MSSTVPASGALITPGEPIAVAEEYLPGEGVYLDSAGFIRSALVGRVGVDRSRRTVSVKSPKAKRLPPAGATVLGMITNLRPDLAIVTIYAEVEIDRRGSVRSVKELPGRLMGAIPLAHIADERINDIHDYFRVGDIVLAATINSGNPYTLSTKQPQHGVVFAQCSVCGHYLEPVSDRQMRCPRCGNVERRKVSTLAPLPMEKLRLRRWMLVAIRA